MAASDLPILKIYDPLLPSNISKVSQHNPYTECSFNIQKNSCECGKNQFNVWENLRMKQ